MFDLNTATDTVAIQSPVNSGFLATTGNLGVGFAADSGFDIYSKLRPKASNRTVELFPYAVSNGRPYDINQLTGQAEDDGRIGVRGVTDIAIPLNQL